MKKSIQFILLSFLLLPSLFFAQNHLLEITHDTTWTLADSPIIIPNITNPGDISIYIENATLTIEEGVVVMGASISDIPDGSDKIVVGSNARILAVGEKNSPIEFTSGYGAGNWGGIIFENGSGTNNNSIFTNCVFSNGGNTDSSCVVEIPASMYNKVIFNNCTFLRNRGGIYSNHGFNVEIEYCEFQNNVSGAIKFIIALGAIIQENYFIGNGYAYLCHTNFPEVMENNIFADRDQRVFLPVSTINPQTVTIPGYIENDNSVMPFTLGINATYPLLEVIGTIIINQGVIIQGRDFGTGKKSKIIVDNYASIITQGVKGNPVTFESENPSEQWGGILIHNNTSTIQSEFNFTKFSGSYTALRANSSNPTINNCSFLNNVVGIVVQSGNVTINNCYIIDNQSIGVTISDDANVDVNNSTILNNSYGVLVQNSSLNLLGSNSSKNTVAGIKTIDGKTIDISDGSIIEENAVGIDITESTSSSSNSNIDISATTIRYNPIGIQSDFSSTTTTLDISGCNLASNFDFAINNKNSTIVNAQNNWWGDASGPLDDSDNASDPIGLYNPGGLGSRVSDFVDYSNWYDFFISDVPNIMVVTDVPNDQGKKVFVGWSTSQFDQLDSELPIIKYSIWRELLTDGGTIVDDKYPSDIVLSNGFKKEMEEGFWEFIGDITPLPELETYLFTAPTLADSNSYGVFYSTYMVVAHTRDPRFYFKSEPRSGYSIDNIEPRIPEGLTSVVTDESVVLIWNQNKEEDFEHYAIYKNDEFLANTIDTLFLDNELTDGNNIYTLTAVDINGNESDAAYVDAVVGVSNETVVKEYSLSQNYPNPFNPSTTIKFALPKAGMVSLKIYNTLGEEVAELINREMNAGVKKINFDASHLSSGLYIYRISTNNFIDVKKMLLLK
jgi:hypothetical protein